MAGLNVSQRMLCDHLGMDHSRLWSLLRALEAARAKPGMVDYDPVDVALAVGYRQGVAYTRKVIEGIARE